MTAKKKDAVEAVKALAAAAAKSPRRKKGERHELKRRPMLLPVKLTAAELTTRREALVALTTRFGETEAALESFRSQRAADLKKHQAQVAVAKADAQRMARVVTDEAEERDVVVIDYLDGTAVVAVREDTGVVISERAAEDYELQLTFPKDGEL